MRDFCAGQEDGKKETKKDEKTTSADDGFAMLPATRKKLLDTLEKGKATLKRLDEIFAARQTANANQLPGKSRSFCPTVCLSLGGGLEVLA